MNIIKKILLSLFFLGLFGSTCYSQSDINSKVIAKNLESSSVYDIIDFIDDSLIVWDGEKIIMLDADLSKISEYQFSESKLYESRRNLELSKIAGRPYVEDCIKHNNRIIVLYNFNTGMKKKSKRIFLSFGEFNTDNLKYATVKNENLLEYVNQQKLIGYGRYSLIKYEKEGKECLALVYIQERSIDDPFLITVELFDKNLKHINSYTNSISPEGKKIRFLKTFISSKGQLFIDAIDGKTRKIYALDAENEKANPIKINSSDKVLPAIQFFELNNTVHGLSYYKNDEGSGIAHFEFNNRTSEISRTNLFVKKDSVPNGQVFTQSNFVTRLQFMTNSKKENLEDGGFIFISEQKRSWTTTKTDGGSSSYANCDSIFIGRFNKDCELKWSSVVPKHQRSMNLGNQFISHYHFIQDNVLNILFNSNGVNYSTEGIYKKNAKKEAISANKMDHLVLAKVDLNTGEIISQRSVLDYGLFKRYITINDGTILYNPSNNFVYGFARGLNTASNKTMGYKIELH